MWQHRKRRHTGYSKTMKEDEVVRGVMSCGDAFRGEFHSAAPAPSSIPSFHDCGAHLLHLLYAVLHYKTIVQRSREIDDEFDRVQVILAHQHCNWATARTPSC